MEPEGETFQTVFAPLFADLQDEQDYPQQRPLLAHYTSVETFEQILKVDQIWFSNPLFMNDWQEVRWGILKERVGRLPMRGSGTPAVTPSGQGSS